MLQRSFYLSHIDSYLLSRFLAFRFGNRPKGSFSDSSKNFVSIHNSELYSDEQIHHPVCSLGVGWNKMGCSILRATQNHNRQGLVGIELARTENP
jgi:hypothetical protein